MKAVILAGGLGTRLSEETSTRPKPMVEIGGRPILWHIMKLYEAHGIGDFIICLGYKGEIVKDYFISYGTRGSDFTIDLRTNDIAFHSFRSEPWRITLLETGATTMTGGRIRRIRDHLDPHEPFCLTYGDGVSDVDIGACIDLHRREGLLATVTAVQPPGRFGAMRVEGNRVTGFREKPDGGEGLINGGFFVVDPRAIDYIEGDQISWENEPMSGLVEDGQLSVHVHDGFWQPMDTLRDKNYLEELWASGSAPWRVWSN